MFIFFLNFQFKRIVFLATANAMSRGLGLWIVELMDEISPSRQIEGENGMVHARMWDSVLVIEFQKS